jgi:aryl-alcohol dehydrogenase-like predicted oxidoreductase
MFGSHGTDGTEIVDERTAHAVLDAAWTHGVNFIDTANVYGEGRSEQYIGSWLRGGDRENFVIASKVFFALSGRQRIGLSRKIVLAEIEGTLDRLGTGYIDLYYIHGWHGSSPLAETLAAFNDLVRAGKVHYIGVSNFTAWQLAIAHDLCRVNGWPPISVIQPRYSAVDHVPYTVDPSEMPLPDLFDACRYLDVAVCPYSPLAEGFLTGKYAKGPDGDIIIPVDSRAGTVGRFGRFPDRWWRVLSEVEAVARELQATPAQVAVKWASEIADLTSIPVVGATKVRQLEETLAAMELALSREQHQRITDAGALPDLNPGVHSYV